MATKLEAYPEYKTSGIDWLGEIPEHWDLVKSSYLFDNIGSGTTPTSGEDYYYDNGTINWLQTGDLNDGIIATTNKRITQFAVDSKNMKFYTPGSLVIAMYGATIAKLGLLNINTTVNQACCVLTPSNNIISKYSFYYFYAAKKDLISLASGGGQPNISQATIANYKILIPPLSEQQEIADFLDAKTAKIDELVKEKQAQLDDIRAYRTSLITETVTRGLNPNAPLKDSGIDWLGEIPEHWEIVKLAWLASVQTGTTPSTSIEKYWINTTKNWFTPGDFDGFEVKDSKRKVSAAAYNEIACRVFPPYTIYLVGIGATLGKVAYCKTEASANQQINAITFKEDIYPIYGLYYLSSINQVIKAVSNSATLPILNQEQTKDLQFLVPPLSEQKEIADFLDAKTSKIDALIDELNKQIEELAEYKRAVITEAVTGKVDVRDWKPKA